IGERRLHAASLTSQLFDKFVHGPAGETNNRTERAGFEIAAMEGNGNDAVAVGINAVLLAARDAPEAIPFKNADHIGGVEGGERAARVGISMRSTFTSSGMRLPRSLAASR